MMGDWISGFICGVALWVMVDVVIILVLWWVGIDWMLSRVKSLKDNRIHNKAVKAAKRKAKRSTRTIRRTTRRERLRELIRRYNMRD